MPIAPAASLRSCRPTRVADGVRWRVWAPRAAKVDLVLLDPSDASLVVSHAMQRDLWGYFELTLPDIPSGQRYAYRLDDGPRRPDPCSMWQPDGIHHPSAVYFADTFAWTDEHWKGRRREELVFYEVHVGTFTAEGTLEAMIPRLESLKQLGITALELMPIAQFPGTRNWGYDGAHLFAVQNSYGGPHGLQRLVDAAHNVGLAVILDIVLNHFGPEGNYIGEFAPYYSSRYTTPWGPAFNFDGRDSDPVRDFVLENVWQWIADFHVDGLRLDAVHAMFDNSPTHILSEIKQCADAATQSRGLNGLIIAESLMNDVRMVRSTASGGYGLDAEWNEDFHHALFAYLTGERHGKYIDFGAVQQLPHVLEHTFQLSGGYSQFRRRRWGAPVGDIPGDRFVIGNQNHDHIGNRALGERLSHLLAPDIQRLSASLMLLAPYLPLIFMGEEYGELNPFLFFCSFEDAALIENVRQGRARDYALEGTVPDPQAESSWSASKLSWNWSSDDFQAGLRRLHADLLWARKQWPALKDFQHRSARLWPDATQATVLELVRGGTHPAQPGCVVAYFNLTDRPQPLPTHLTPTADPIDSDPLGKERIALFRSEQSRYGCPVEASAMGREELQLRPHECLVMGPAEYMSFVP
ncbi:MAG: malto-oligosyltrehalose trehalohydrolase [Pirellulaceae bacterium]|nr:malto-oligosyltrehalose trehalohydrolase [Pirellulaceae bacterium]